MLPTVRGRPGGVPTFALQTIARHGTDEEVAAAKAELKAKYGHTHPEADGDTAKRVDQLQRLNAVISAPTAYACGHTHRLFKFLRPCSRRRCTPSDQAKTRRLYISPDIDLQAPEAASRCISSCTGCTSIPRTFSLVFGPPHKQRRASGLKKSYPSIHPP
ncbi:hypothetical protein B0H19DRAFT_1270744 [Mycena capillaripes]|nr:hypothetical protein B0H19DRAFT_1270744 [Mycena capillaripes]